MQGLANVSYGRALFAKPSPPLVEAGASGGEGAVVVDWIAGLALAVAVVVSWFSRNL